MVALLLRPAFCLALLTTTVAQTPSPTSDGEVDLVTSSPFTMLLQPVEQSLDFATLRLLEESAATTLQEEGLESDVIVQQVERQNDIARLRFFVLATTNLTTQQVNSLIEMIFDENSDGFLDLLVDNDILAQVKSVAVALLEPTTRDPDSNPNTEKSLATLDIILMSVSAGIFLGIVYMIFQHHKDRGYIENQRMRAVNQRMADRVDDYDEHNERNDDRASETKSPDSSPSTSNTSHQSVEEFGNPETPERIVRITAISNMTPAALLTASSINGSSVHTLSETFENNWFEAMSPHQVEEEKKLESSSADSSSDGSSSSSDVSSGGDSSSDSEDVFDVAVRKSNKEKAPYHPSIAIAEWIKTIRVIPTDNKTSELTASESPEPSLEATSLASLEQVSLEQSMAASECEKTTSSAKSKRSTKSGRSGKSAASRQSRIVEV